MIISRTPFRVSFLGGGTDYPVWYENNGGAVLSTTIDKYCYLTCRYLPPFFEHKHRIVYSKIERVKRIDEICHPSAREILKFMNISDGIEIHHDGDLPARTGLGSSSAFTVGLFNSLYALKGVMPTKHRLAKEAIYIEREALKESVGSQDQVAVSYGGLNKISFGKEGDFHVEPIILSKQRQNHFQDHLMLFFTGFSRIASKIAKKQIKNTPKKKDELTVMHQLVDEAKDVLCGGDDIDKFGRLLHESWKLKRSLSNKVSSPVIDEIYEEALQSGATGGKLIGAGGGGFILLFVKPQLQNNVRKRLKRLLEVKFKFDKLGSQIIFYQDLAVE
ncbi:MAG: kinase [Candidatus Omnitrophota bacterium]|nr:kinase [Candidatus Omnitrophota bacterium]